MAVQLGFHRACALEISNLRFSSLAWLTWMGIKWNWAAIIDSHCSNFDNKMNHLPTLWGFYDHFTDFRNVSFWGKVPSASHDDVITWLGHDKNCLQVLRKLLLGSSASLLRWFDQLKTTPPSTVSEYITPCLSEWERDAQLQKSMWWQPVLILWRTAANKWTCGKHCISYCVSVGCGEANSPSDSIG